MGQVAGVGRHDNLKPRASRVCYPVSVQGSVQILMTRIGLGAQLGIKEHPLGRLS